MLRPEAGLFEHASDGDGAAYLPRAAAPRDALRQCGRVLLKAVVDDHPMGLGIAPFVLVSLACVLPSPARAGAARRPVEHLAPSLPLPLPTATAPAPPSPQEWLAGQHERRCFGAAEAALEQLAHFDARPRGPTRWPQRSLRTQNDLPTAAALGPA